MPSHELHSCLQDRHRKSRSHQSLVWYRAHFLTLWLLHGCMGNTWWKLWKQYREEDIWHTHQMSFHILTNNKLGISRNKYNVAGNCKRNQRWSNWSYNGYSDVILRKLISLLKLMPRLLMAVLTIVQHLELKKLFHLELEEKGRPSIDKSGGCKCICKVATICVFRQVVVPCVGQQEWVSKSFSCSWRQQIRRASSNCVSDHQNLGANIHGNWQPWCPDFYKSLPDKHW